MAMPKVFYGKKIRLLRVEHDISNKELACTIGCTTGFLTMIEDGQRDPSLAMAYRIAKYFGLTVDELIQK